jgi:hypothetical protein
VIPFEPSGKGYESVQGLDDIVGGLEENLDIEVGVLAIVPNRYEGLNTQEQFLGDLEAEGWNVPVTFRKRSSLLEGCWDKQCTAFRYIDAYRDRERDHELDTLEKFDDLAEYIRRRTEVPA